MTVYVDPVVYYPSVKLVHKRWSHMFADTPEELHAMANRIGLERKWYQDHHSNPALHHYDVTPSKRVMAIRFGAVAVETKVYMRAKRLEASVT